MSYMIEKAIPLPDAKASKYPFDAMEIGDSFFVAETSRRNSINSAGALRKPKKFTIRKVDGGLRVWRTA